MFANCTTNCTGHECINASLHKNHSLTRLDAHWHAPAPHSNRQMPGLCATYQSEGLPKGIVHKAPFRQHFRSGYACSSEGRGSRVAPLSHHCNVSVARMSSSRGLKGCMSSLRGQTRQRGDLNPCGQSPMDFESITLTTRSHCLGPRRCHIRNTHCASALS